MAKGDRNQRCYSSSANCSYIILEPLKFVRHKEINNPDHNTGSGSFYFILFFLRKFDDLIKTVSACENATKMGINCTPMNTCTNKHMPFVHDGRSMGPISFADKRHKFSIIDRNCSVYGCDRETCIQYSKHFVVLLNNQFKSENIYISNQCLPASFLLIWLRRQDERKSDAEHFGFTMDLVVFTKQLLTVQLCTDTAKWSILNDMHDTRWIWFNCLSFTWALTIEIEAIRNAHKHIQNEENEQIGT